MLGRFIEEREMSFKPLPLLKDKHLMTIIPTFWPRRFTISATASEKRVFKVAPDSRVLTHCHWQKNRANKPTLLVLHGLEGSSNSHYLLGTAQKAFALGLNVVRMNMRNCGGTLELTPTLYNSGLSSDLIAVVEELIEVDDLKSFFLAGWSMGGNLVLKAASELSENALPFLSGVCAISPSFDLAECVSALERKPNRIYELNFLNKLKDKLKAKKRLFPDRYDLSQLDLVTSIRLFDELYTAPDGGYGTAENYYRSASALPVIDRIKVPVLLIQAQDDPFVPWHSFASEKLQAANICLLSPEHGGHAGFVHAEKEDLPIFDRFWAENRVVKFCLRIQQLHKGL